MIHDNMDFGYGSDSANGHHKVTEPDDSFAGITLEQYATSKKLPIAFLKSLNLKDTNYDFNPAVRIPYPNELGKEVYHRYRVALKGEPRFKAPAKATGAKPIPYGLQVLADARKAGYILLVEGESDTQVCWYNDIPTLGIPGVQAWKRWGKEWAEHLHNIPLILVPVESDSGGDKFWNLISNTPSLYGRVHKLPITTPHAKDIGKVWEQAAKSGQEETFRAAVEALISVVKRGVDEFSSNPGEGPRGFEENLLPTVSLKEVTEEAKETSEYYAYPLFRAGELTLLVGEAKFSGKTTLAFSALKTVLEGEPFLGEETKFTKVLYLSEQGNNLSRAVGTSKINLNDEDSFRVVRFRDVWRFPWAPMIERGVFTCEYEDRQILVVDTFSAFSHLKGSQENDAGEVSERLEPLKVAAQAHDLAVMLIHHSGRDSVIRGSSAFDGIVDTIVVLSRPPGNPGGAGDNVRHITADGRCDPLRLNIELSEEGVYIPVGSSDRIMFTKAVRAIREVAPTKKTSAIDLDTFVGRVKSAGTDASKATIERAILWLWDQETLIREGRGVKGDAFKYWIRGGFSDVSSFGTKDLQKGGLQDSPQTSGDPSGGLRRNEKPPLILDNTGLAELAGDVSRISAPIAIDTETSSLQVNEAKIRLIQVKVGEDVTPVLVDSQAVDVRPLLDVLKDKHLLGHNLAYDLAVLSNCYGYEHRGPLTDTMLMFQVYYGGTNKRANLKDALKAILGVEISKDEQASDWMGELTTEMLTYAATDVAYLHALKDALKTKINDSANHLWPVVDLEHRMTKVTAHMSAVGMPVDEAVFAECVQESKKGAAQKLSELDDLVSVEVSEEYVKRNTKSKAVPDERNEKVNWNSPEQVLWVFKQVARINLGSTSKETLFEVDHPIAAALLEYRQVLDVSKRFRETKVVDGRVYANWNQLKARTGRMSCEKPPLQGIPDPLRRAFVAPDGYKLVVSDLSQIEIRVLATICSDENLRHDLIAGRDVHRRVAASIFSKSYEEVSDKERKMAKSLVFGTLYGMGLSGFTARVNAMTGKHYSSDHVEREFRRPLFAPYPKVRVWMDEVARDYESEASNKVSYTRLGRRRLQVPDIPAALNTPIQAGATDVMKAIAVAAYEGRYPYWEIVGLVHDEILLLVPEDDAHKASNWLHETMTRVGGAVVNQGVPEKLRVVVDAGTQICDSWAEKA